jgi:hypothetical protein
MGIIKRMFGFAVGLATLLWVGSLYARMPPGRLAQVGPEIHLIASLFVVTGLYLVARSLVPAKRNRRYRGVGKNVLDMVLLMWSPNDSFRVRDLVAGGICIIGKTGSGKTSSSGYQLLKAIVNARPGGGVPRIGGLCIASKPGDKREWQRIFHAAGRSSDLLVFEPGAGLHFNVIDFEMQNGADSHEITKFVMTIDDAMQRGDGGRDGSNEKFWEKAKQRVIYNAVEIIRKAKGRVSAPALASFHHRCGDQRNPTS